MWAKPLYYFSPIPAHVHKQNMGRMRWVGDGGVGRIPWSQLRGFSIPFSLKGWLFPPNAKSQRALRESLIKTGGTCKKGSPESHFPSRPLLGGSLISQPSVPILAGRNETQRPQRLEKANGAGKVKCWSSLLWEDMSGLALPWWHLIWQ